MYARVIVDITHKDVDRLFTYAVPPQMELSVGLRVRVPFGPRALVGFVVELTQTCDIDPAKVKEVLSPVDDYPVLTEELVRLAFWMRDTYSSTVAQALRVMLPAQIRSEKIRPLTRLAVRLLVTKQEAYDACARAKKQMGLLDLLDEFGQTRIDLLEEQMDGARAVAAAMQKKGLLAVEPIQVRRVPFSDLQTTDQAFIPTAQQAQAIAAILQAMDQGGDAFLLYGVTGSGKTEVYMHAIQRALQLGKGAIVLVPEISLTPQMASWFRARFGDTAAILHSKLSDGEKFDEWKRIRSGEARVVVGARSAVFAPMESIGLIVVDEEHEASYRSDKHPLYDARDTALQRCRMNGGVLVLGSATPAVPTFAKAMNGEYTLLEMSVRVQGRPMPAVEVVDMRQEIVAGNKSIFSRRLYEALQETIAKGEQAVLFLNRRGYSSFVKCLACGYTQKCEHCDVTMTYHKLDHSLRCHYCGSRMPLLTTCPVCGSSYIKPVGIGTQKVEEVFQKAFPGVKTVRLDADTTAQKDALVKLLQRFRNREAQVMIGTQMVAKGHDFPNVTLVGVVLADLTLNVQDYRSEERTFQLLTQVEGRAGRGVRPGTVIVQSYEPEHYAVEMAATQDYRAFYLQEIKRRRQRLYPPYTKLMRVLVTCEEAGDARAAAEAIAEELKDWFTEDPVRRKQFVHVRAMEAPMARIRDVYRYQVFIKLYARDAEPFIGTIQSMIQPYESGGVMVSFEIDPPSFM